MPRTPLTANSFPPLSRRRFIAGIGAAGLAVSQSQRAEAQPMQTLALEAKPATILLGSDQAPTPIWALTSASAPPRLKTGQLEVTFRNSLPVPAALDWRGIDGALTAEPLTARPAISPGADLSFALPLHQAGTFFADLRLLATPEAPPCRPLPFIVEESAAIPTDDDEILLIEDWRAAQAASRSNDEPRQLFTVNGQILPDIAVRSGARLRLRFINGSQRQVVAVKIEDREVRVIAMDSAPAEPFPARNGALVLAPGGRVDALIDTPAAPGGVFQLLLHDGQQARPLAQLVASGAALRSSPLPPPAALPADGLPAQLDLKSALRVDLALQGSEWVSPAGFFASLPPVFKAKTGRAIVLAVNNRDQVATSFHLHGHHFRLLDRLDDGWKPFWLDTLVVEPGQTQRIAFAATFAGRWLVESMSTRPTSPRLVRWYSVD